MLVDGAHFNGHVVEGSDFAFAEFLRRDGYRVRPLSSKFMVTSLSAADILVIPIPLSARNQIRGDSASFFSEELTDWSRPHPSAKQGCSLPCLTRSTSALK